MRVWERPAIQMLALFLGLGLFAWWTFRTVSLPPVFRNLIEEDEAIAVAATPLTEEQQFQQELARLPAPPQNHAPQVADLLTRLRNLPPLPFLLQAALQRDATTPPGQEPAPWNEAELQALREMQSVYLAAWEPFLSGPAPNWARFPDSVLVFRSRSFLLEEQRKIADLTGYQPGQINQRSFSSDPRDYPEFLVPLLKQCRRMGAIRFGQLRWEVSETIRVAQLTQESLERLVNAPGVPLQRLENILMDVAPAPDLPEIRDGLSADRALFLKTAEYLESLPSSTSAKAGLARWLQDDSDAGWYVDRAGQPASAKELGSLLRRDAAQLEILRQKTFLPGPGWRQWLSGDPGAGLSHLLSQGIDGFIDFEMSRATYLLTQAALEARIALEKNGLKAARRIPDPTRPGTFLQLVQAEEGVRISSSYVPAGETNSVYFFVPLSPDRSP